MDFDVKFDASQSQHSSAPSNSSENFQKFMYDLFEKNGILNNLRAHLRSHIINVLKNATNGNQPISTPVNFKKHLEPNHQALNILLAEYLLKMELNYSLSVFVSEIPLANMPFGFAKLLLLRPHEEMQAHKLQEDDIISVLNCLGIHCDSDVICQVMGQYKNTDTSLLQCILQSLTFYQKKPRNIDDYHPSNVMSQTSSSIKSSDFDKNKQNNRSQLPTCNHIRKCAACEEIIIKLKEKYADKIRRYKKNATSDFARDSRHHNLSNIDVLEKRLIDEMFQEVRSVYEGELQMLKSSEERRIHASVASHAIALKKRIAQLEDQYHEKESQLLVDVRDKKQLLRSIMDSIQHEHQLLTNTIRNINQEAQKLAQREEQMKKQIQEAELFIKQRSQEMTTQIQCELEILITHLRSLKEEKLLIAKEKNELENLKKYCEKQPQTENTSRENRAHCKDPDHILVTNQLRKLKNILETLGVTKDSTERSTITELKDVTSKLNVLLNNEQDLGEERPHSFKITPNKVFNQFRKDKNINFCVNDPEEVRRDVCTSSSHRNIREENENLRSIAAQQSARIQELSNEVARAHTERATPNTLRATVFQPFNVQLQRLSAMPGSSNPAGGGEELNAFRGRPVSAPAVTVPFIDTSQDAQCSRQRASRHTNKAYKSRRNPTHDKVLQEARRTLRKLEIEAEAVHNSYVDFKRKRDSGSVDDLAGLTSQQNTTKKTPREVIAMDATNQITNNEKLFRKLTESVRLVNPIPEEYGALRPPRERTRNYVDTPLTEFRKLYNCTEKNNQEKPLEPFNRGIFINDEKVICTKNLDVPEQNDTPKNESKQTYDKTKVTDVYTCGIINDFRNKCAEICLDIPMRDIATSEYNDKPRFLKLEIENITSYAYLDSPKKSPLVLEIQNSVDNNEIEIVTIKPSDTQEPHGSAEIVTSSKETEKQNKPNTHNSPTKTPSENDFDIRNLIKIHKKIEKLKIENDDYQNDDFEESSSEENVTSKSEAEEDKPRLNTINEEDKDDRIFELLSNTTNDLEIDDGDEYPDDFTDLVASGDSPKSIAKQYTDTDNENFWQP